MPSGTAADADKPITPLVLKTPSVIGSASATLMMSRAASLAHQQDGYTNAAAPPATAERDQIRLLARGVHTRGVRPPPTVPDYSSCGKGDKGRQQHKCQKEQSTTYNDVVNQHISRCDYFSELRMSLNTYETNCRQSHEIKHRSYNHHNKPYP